MNTPLVWNMWIVSIVTTVQCIIKDAYIAAELQDQQEFSRHIEWILRQSAYRCRRLRQASVDVTLQTRKPS